MKLRISRILSAAIFTVAFCLSPSSTAGQAQTDEKTLLRQTRLQAVARFNAADFDEAAKFAQQAVDLSLKIFGADHVETAAAYTNLGEVLRAKHKYSGAVATFQRALAIYEKSEPQNRISCLRVLRSLGTALALDGHSEEAQSAYLRAVDTAEKLYGGDSKELLPSLKSLTDFYIYSKQFDKADDLFVRRYLIRDRYIEKDQAEGVEDVGDEHLCYMTQNFVGEKYSTRQKVFDLKMTLEKNRLGIAEKPPTSGPRGGSVVNGKALSLPKPSFPSEARDKGISGTVLIKVMIGEDGSVLSAKGFCGDTIFFPVAEAAARAARFTPTILNGEPVKVSGFITYNFVR